jgi:hypothetical protein
MNSKLLKLLKAMCEMAALVLCLGSLGAAEIPQFAIKSFTIDGGGTTGVSADQHFRLTGTVGQPEASVAVGNGNFSLESGFWHRITVVQASDAPRLSIRLNRFGQAVLSWGRDVSGFELEETIALGGPWNPVRTAVVDTATEHTVTVPAAGNIKCYRLRKKE